MSYNTSIIPLFSKTQVKSKYFFPLNISLKMFPKKKKKKLVLGLKDSKCFFSDLEESSIKVWLSFIYGYISPIESNQKYISKLHLNLTYEPDLDVFGGIKIL